MSNQDSQLAIYLYCLTSDLDVSIQRYGVDGRHLVYVYDFQNIRAVISEVDLEDFCGPGAEDRLKNIDWIGPRAIIHEQIIEEVMSVLPVFPVPFGTLFSTMGSLKELLSQHHKRIANFLNDYRYFQEWSVKGYIDENVLTESLFQELQNQEKQRLDSLPPGRRYFQEKYLQKEAENQSKTFLDQAFSVLHSKISPFVDQLVERKLLSKQATGKKEKMVFNWAVFLSKEVTSDLRQMIDQERKRLISQGLWIEISGPWPPYSFCPPLAG